MNGYIKHVGSLRSVKTVAELREGMTGIYLVCPPHGSLYRLSFSRPTFSPRIEGIRKHTRLACSLHYTNLSSRATCSRCFILLSGNIFDPITGSGFVRLGVLFPTGDLCSKGLTDSWLPLFVKKLRDLPVTALIFSWIISARHHLGRPKTKVREEVRRATTQYVVDVHNWPGVPQRQ